MAAPEVSPGLQALLASLDPAARSALTAALQQGRVGHAELAQAWQACGGSPKQLTRWLTGRLGGATVPDARASSSPAMVADTLVEGSTPARSGATASLERVGPYAVERELARGGMGIVYVARHAQLGRRVALKVLPAGARGEEAERFQLEAQAAARLKHPNVVGVHEVGVHGGQPWLAMDLIEGESLQARLGRDGPLGEEEAGAILEKVARAVAYAHKAGVLHRDIKPHNVLLDAQGEPFLADFGLAKDVTQSAKGVTVSGQVLGTPAYMPPEQAAGELELVDRRADVYSLGATLYHALTGRAPYDGATVVNVITKVLTTDPPRPTTLRPRLDRDLETVCLHAMERDPAARYPTAHALAEDLRRWREGLPITARPVGALERLWRRARRNRALTAAVAALCVVAVTVWAAVTVQLDRSRDEAVRARQAAERAVVAEQAATGAATLANVRLEVLRRVDRGALLLSLGRHVEAERELEGALRDAEAGLADEQVRRPLVAAAERGLVEARLHLGRAVSDGRRAERACAFGPDGRVLATTEGDDVVVRDLEAGEELLRASVGSCAGASLAFTPDGATLLATVEDPGGSTTEVAWDLRRREERWRHAGVRRRGCFVAVDATGELAAISDLDGLTTIVDPASGREVRPRLHADVREGCAANDAYAYAAAFAPAEVGPLLAVGYSDGLLTFWSVASGDAPAARRESGRMNLLAAPTALAWPPPGALVPGKVVFVHGDASGKVMAWELKDGQVGSLATLLEGEAGRVMSLTVRHVAGGEALLAAGTQDGSAWLWDGALRLRRRIHTPEGQVTTCALSGDGQVFATAGPSRAWLWSPGPRRLQGGGPVTFTRDGEHIVRCRRRQSETRKPPIVVDGKRLEAAELGYDVVVHPLRGGAERSAELPNLYGPVRLQALTTTDAGEVVVSVWEHNDQVKRRFELWVWDPARDAPPRTLALEHSASALAVLPGGELVTGREVVPNTDEPRLAHVERRRLTDGQVTATHAWHVLTVTALAARGDGTVVSASLDGSVAWWPNGSERPARIVDPRSGAALDWQAPDDRPPISFVDHRERVSALGQSPSGVVAVGLGDGTVRLISPDPARSGEPSSLQGHEDELLLCAFTRGGELLVTASRDGKARVWDVEQRSVLRTIDVPGGRLASAAVSPDERWLALAAPQEVWLHELATGRD